jgi:glycosyltransferase involved in cell wall biosynthesis
MILPDPIARAAHDWLFDLGCVTWLVAVVIGVDLLRGKRQIVRLKSIEPLAGPLPRVSIVIAARNEAGTIEPALRSVLALDYPNREIVVVDDRSDDGTGAILDRLAREHAELRIVHLDSLPPGWIGKNHALYEGTRRATGEYLLLTDADVVIAPSTLRRAVAFARSRQLDHLALFPEILTRSWLLDLVIGSFGIFFNSYLRPWKARDPRSRAFIGIGAFNFIRREAYERAGTHEVVRMRPDEDIKLGKRIKQCGLRQDIASALDLVEVEWYPSTGAFIRGLEKNLFAGVDYRLSLMLLSCLLVIGLDLVPPFGVVIGPAPVRIVYLLVWLTYWAIYADSARFLRTNPWLGVLFPLGAAIYLVALVNSTAKTLRHRGIRWRDTYYPLAELKANII